MQLRLNQETHDSGPRCSKVDGTIHRRNHYPLDDTFVFYSIYPVDSDLSAG